MTVLVVGLSLWPARPSSAGSIEPTLLAVQRVCELPADRLGVDGEGNFWTWEQQSGRVRLLTPQGEEAGDLRIPGATALDADRRWGIATLHDDGSTLKITGPSGALRLALDLREPASGVAWVSETTVAVASKMASYRVMLWDLESHRPIRTFGAEKPIDPGEGAVFVRTMDLEMEPERGYLYTLDSLTGSFEVFTLSGDLIQEARADNPEQAVFETWLAGIDQQVRQEHGVQFTSIWWFDLAVDPEGRAWTVRQCDSEPGLLELVRLSGPDAPETVRVPFAGGQCSKRLTIWGSRFLLGGKASRPLSSCWIQTNKDYQSQ